MRTRALRGLEIWAQTQGRVDAFVAATGTGGTLAGVATYLKSRRREIRCVLADPPGSSLYEYIRSGTLKATGSSSITEGIGIGRVTANLAGAPIDAAVHHRGWRDRRLRVPAAARGRPVPRQHQRHQPPQRRCAWRVNSGPGHTVVTVLCDGGAKYQSRLFNREWLQSKGLASHTGMPPGHNPLSLARALVA